MRGESLAPPGHPRGAPSPTGTGEKTINSQIKEREKHSGICARPRISSHPSHLQRQKSPTAHHGDVGSFVQVTRRWQCPMSLTWNSPLVWVEI